MPWLGPQKEQALLLKRTTLRLPPFLHPRQPQRVTQTRAASGRATGPSTGAQDETETETETEPETEIDAFAAEAFRDARALVGGGAGLSPRTLKRNERAPRGAARGDEGRRGQTARDRTLLVAPANLETWAPLSFFARPTQ